MTDESYKTKQKKKKNWGIVWGTVMVNEMEKGKISAEEWKNLFYDSVRLKFFPHSYWYVQLEQNLLFAFCWITEFE